MLGFGFSIPKIAVQGSRRGGGAALLPAPVLTWVSDTDDNEPNFSVDLPAEASPGDEVEIQISDNADFAGSPVETELGTVVGDPVAMETDVLANGTYWARARYTGSAWSNTETKTIDVPEMSAEAAAFLARTPGLDETHTDACVALIDGLVAAGIAAKDDFRVIYSNEDTTTRNLNLWGTDYTSTPQGSPTWAADVGYTTDTNKYVDTGFNLSTGAHFSQNSARVSVWSGSTGGSDYAIFGTADDSGAQSVHLRHFTNTSEAALKMNDNDFGTVITGPANGGGNFVAQRINATTKQIWRNGVQVGGDITQASLAPANVNLLTGGNFTTAVNQYNGIIRSMAAGSHLTPTEIAAEHSLMAAFMAAIGASP